MLDFRFKKCCKNCDDIGIDYDVLEKRYVGEDKLNKDCTVHCSHDKVCKKYKECDEVWPNQT